MLPRMKPALGFCGALFVSSTIATSVEAKPADPCDFASSGKATFPYDQVMSCYRSVPFSVASLHNIVDVVAQHRAFSDLGEIYDSRIHWKRALGLLGAVTSPRAYPNDLAMHDAIKRDHKEFRDVHVAYEPPGCYWQMLSAFVPLEFGSLVRQGRGGPEQIIFVEDAPILPDLYQGETGIDARQFIGLRVVSINGVPVLEYFRRYSESQKTHEDAGGGLNGVLGDYEYSFRLGGSYDFIPENPEDTYVFESVDGKRQTVKLPWVFSLASPILGDLALPPSNSSEQFVQMCSQPPAENTSSSSGLTALSDAWGVRQRVDHHRHEAVRRLRSHSRSHGSRAGYFEVAKERLGKGVQEIIPPTNQARVVQVDGHITALQLRDTVGWTDVARQGIEYACTHSDRLIVDVRNNNGGNDTVIRWLHHYLFPETGATVTAGLLPMRLRNDHPTFNEILYNLAQAVSEYLPEIGNDPCAAFLVPGCLTDVNNGAALASSRYDWYLHPTQFELRAARLVTLSRQVGLPNVGNPLFDSASCAGKFADQDLVILTNGTNASGGYFLPAAFKGDAVIVNTGGYLGEPMAMGRARGGATVPGSIWAYAKEQLEAVSSGRIVFKYPIARPDTPFETRMEMLGAYRKDRRTLHIDDPIEADLHVYVWTNQAGSESFVYDRVLRAVDGWR
jgi:hypothetical protein